MDVEVFGKLCDRPWSPQSPPSTWTPLSGSVSVVSSSIAPDSKAQSCPLSGRQSTYPTVRNCGATSADRRFNRDRPRTALSPYFLVRCKKRTHEHRSDLSLLLPLLGRQEDFFSVWPSGGPLSIMAASAFFDKPASPIVLLEGLLRQYSYSSGRTALRMACRLIVSPGRSEGLVGKSLRAPRRASSRLVNKSENCPRCREQWNLI